MKRNKLNREITRKVEPYNGIEFFQGLIFYAPVALLVRTQAGISLQEFFWLQLVLSMTIFLLEIPAGILTDKIGYGKTLVLAQIMLLLARILLLFGFLRKSMLLFLAEALIEGIASCFTSGTGTAYLYNHYGNEEFLARSTRAANWGVIGFVISTVCYVIIYHFSGMMGLLVGTIGSSFLGMLCGMFLKPDNKIIAKEAVQKFSGGKNILGCKELWGYAIFSAVISIGFLFINFFYADKLMECHMDVKWLTPIILGYSLIQMLAEKIVTDIGDKHRRRYFILFTLGTSLLFAIFGVCRQPMVAVVLMLMIPLFISIPSFLMEEMENQLIDSYGAEDKRATILSVLHMGTNSLEVLFLCASAMISGIGLNICYLFLGVLFAGAGLAVWKMKAIADNKK